MKEKEKMRQLSLQSVIYCLVFLIFQLICGLEAYYNGKLDAYMNPVVVQSVISIAGIMLAVWLEGNARIVLYASMLLSAGHLIQSIIQTEEAYEKYLKDYFKFLVIAVVAAAVLWAAYSRFYYLLERKYVILLLCIGCYLILGSLFLFDTERNGAKLWITIAGTQIQLSELLKPLFVVCMAGLLCTKEKLSQAVQIGSILFCGSLALIMAGILNEFGTALVIAITGVVMIYVFQNAKMSKWLAILFVIAFIATVLCYALGNSLYRSLPMKVSDEVFAENFGAAGNKERLAEILEEELEASNQDEIQKKEEELDFSYSKMIQFLRYVITDDEVNESYTGAVETFDEHQITYRAEIAKLASDSGFREKFQDEFLSRKIYTNRMLAAYLETYGAADGSLGRLRGIKYTLFRYYMNIAGKIQEKFRGFLNPEEEAMDAAYHVNQSLSAMAGGGVLGNGPDILKSTDIYSAESDMVFSMIVAELGGISGILVILLNMLIFKEAVQIALDTRSMYQKGVSIGFGVCWFAQAAIIIAGNCRLIPFTGITLPLISRGGTSMIISILTVVLLTLISIKPMQAHHSGQSVAAGRSKNTVHAVGIRHNRELSERNREEQQETTGTNRWEARSSEEAGERNPEAQNHAWQNQATRNHGSGTKNLRDRPSLEKPEECSGRTQSGRLSQGNTEEELQKDLFEDI